MQKKAPMQKKHILRLTGIIVLILSMGGCSFGFPGVYRIDVAQGNLLDEQKVAEVKIGMEPRQVRYLLGTPLITDTFNQDRWDYFYSVKQGKNTTVEHHLSVFFEAGRVVELKNNIKSDESS